MFYKLSMNKTQTRDRGADQKLVINEIRKKRIISWLQLHMETKLSLVEGESKVEITGYQATKKVIK